jgi:2-keto-3-deoxy-6-phosphogluconate aldolase
VPCTPFLALADEGVGLIEVSLTTTDALGVIRAAAAEPGGDMFLGAGTVLTPDHVRAVAEAGSRQLREISRRITHVIDPDERSLDG